MKPLPCLGRKEGRKEGKKEKEGRTEGRKEGRKKGKEGNRFIEFLNAMYIVLIKKYGIIIPYQNKDRKIVKIKITVHPRRKSIYAGGLERQFIIQQ